MASHPNHVGHLSKGYQACKGSTKTQIASRRIFSKPSWGNLASHRVHVGTQSIPSWIPSTSSTYPCRKYLNLFQTYTILIQSYRDKHQSLPRDLDIWKNFVGTTGHPTCFILGPYPIPSGFKLSPLK